MGLSDGQRRVGTGVGGGGGAVGGALQPVVAALILFKGHFRAIRCF